MANLTAGQIMNMAIRMDEGEKVIVECASYEEMESLRTHLYRVRSSLLKTHPSIANMLWISRKIDGDNYFVSVVKEKTVSNAFIVGKDGTIRPFEKDDAGMITSESEDQRIARLMREDGKTEEEIAEYFAEKGEQDFDAAASKIEKSQGLTSQDDELELDVSKKRQ